MGIATDGDGTGTANVVTMGALTSTGATTITLSRTGLTTFFPNAANKIIQTPTLTVTGPLVVTNSNGYGLDVQGAVAFSADQTVSVTNATASNVVQGLTIDGVVSGNFNLIKTGAGALALNGVSTFGGTGKSVDIQAGVLAVNGDSALGDSNNVVKISSATSVLRFTGSGAYNVAHTVNLNATNTATATNNIIEVALGAAPTLTSAFTLSGTGDNLVKNDNGVLGINVSNGTFAGTTTINAGAILLQNSTALGTSAITIAPAIGAGIQLSGGVTINNAITITLSGQLNGINGGGVIESVSGVNTWAGSITQAAGVAATNYGADVGATLNFTGVWAATNSAAFGGGGTINFQSALPAFSSNNYYSGGLNGTATTLNLTVNSPAFVSILPLRNANYTISGAGVKLGITGLITIDQGSSLTVDDTGLAGAATASRLSGRPVTLEAGTFNYKVNGNTASTETVGALVLNAGGSTINVDTTAGVQSSTLTFGATTAAVGGTLNVTGTFGTATNKIALTQGAGVTLVGGAVAATNGLLARVTVNGNEFATYNTNGVATNTNGLQAFAGYSAQTDITLAAATDTYKALGTTGNTVAASQTLNALTLNGGSVDSVSGVVPTTLTLTAGGDSQPGGEQQPRRRCDRFGRSGRGHPRRQRHHPHGEHGFLRLGRHDQGAGRHLDAHRTAIRQRQYDGRRRHAEAQQRRGEHAALQQRPRGELRRHARPRRQGAICRHALQPGRGRARRCRRRHDHQQRRRDGDPGGQQRHRGFGFRWHDHRHGDEHRFVRQGEHRRDPDAGEPEPVLWRDDRRRRRVDSARPGQPGEYVVRRPQLRHAEYYEYRPV